MQWRVAASLLHLRDQVNAKWPGRGKANDGTIGDAAHGVVSEDIANAIRLSHDPRVKYIISNRKIATSYAVHGEKAWEWRTYHGRNPHDHHCHISVLPTKSLYDSTADWHFVKEGT